eukprot:TRINITY_DN3132_c0_g1_i2.p2 TRINITY_DN3132_c0_g1~~TRINITY_DN3132_c0_g1_i2.p2  ORF type:complete len:307 (-),score=92.70 TRINITY_DN3132_c0_g1_i2:80-1000(-)
MQELHVTTEGLCEAWFDRLFVGVMCMEAVLQALDCYLCEGKIVLYRVCLSLLRQCEKDTDLMAATSSYEMREKAAKVAMAVSTPQFLIGNALSSDIGFEFTDDVTDLPEWFLVKQEQNRQGKAVVSNMFLEPPTPDNPSGLLSDEQFDQVWKWLPTRYKVLEPSLLFTTKKDGFNLHYLYELCAGHAPLILVAKSQDGHLFGAYVPERLSVYPEHYYGTGETFLFSISPVAAKYEWSPVPPTNSYFLLVEQSQLCIGGGDEGFGLSLDEELQHGSSHQCDTFHNRPLHCGVTPAFECVELEVLSIK